jgi:hypothetical protein
VDDLNIDSVDMAELVLASRRSLTWYSPTKGRPDALMEEVSAQETVANSGGLYHPLQGNAGLMKDLMEGWAIGFPIRRCCRPLWSTAPMPTRGARRAWCATSGWSFLGDSVLGFVVAQHLTHLSGYAGGAHDRLRAELVCETEPLRRGPASGAGKCLRLGKGECSPAPDTPVHFGRRVEAVIAALFLDGASTWPPPLSTARSWRL